MNPDWDCLQANQMSISSKTNNVIVRFRSLTTFNQPGTTVQSLYHPLLSLPKLHIRSILQTRERVPQLVLIPPLPAPL
jgi:hypothetical protein